MTGPGGGVVAAGVLVVGGAEASAARGWVTGAGAERAT